MLKKFPGLSILFLILLAALSACGPTTVKQIEQKYNAEQYTPEQVLKLVESNTMLFVSFHEDSYFYFDRSGRVYGTDINNNKDLGKWDVTDSGELCMRLQHWWYGDLRCYSVYSDGDKYALTNNSEVIIFTARQFTGDYKNQYYEVKAAKKSYRRSVRKKQAEKSAITEEEAIPETSDETKDASTYDVSSSYTTSDSEIKSTVKWMAKDCPGCNLSKSNLKKADLVGAKLHGANLSNADLSMADLRRADLQNANLESADLTFANMPGANLRNSNLKNANLKGANLIRADFTGAELEGINLEGALLEGTVGIP